MHLTIAELATALEAESWGDTSAEIRGAAEPGAAGPDELALALSPRYGDQLQPGGLALLAPGMDPAAHDLRAAIIVPRPRLAMAGLTRALDPGPAILPGIHPSAVISATAAIGEDAAIGPLVVIGDGARIGPRARIGAGAIIGTEARIGADAMILPRVHIAHNVLIGDRVVIQPGAVIGGDGFSFATLAPSGIEEVRSNLDQAERSAPEGGTHWHRVHSLGWVEIGDDVEIGANATIDRGTIRATRIGNGTKIDNLVQIGHNVTIGNDSMICSMTGVSGSASIGDRVVLAGQCGVSDNIFIGDDVIAGGATKIYTNVPAGRVLLGPSGLRMKTELEARRNIRRLPRILAQIAEMRETLARLTEKGDS